LVKMTTAMPISRAIQILLVWLMLTIFASSQTSSRLSTCFLARGEQARLEISIIGEKPDHYPRIAPVENLVIQPSSSQPRTNIVNGRKLEYVFDYNVSSYDTGDYVIPPVAVSVGGDETKTEPLKFQVFNPDELQWSEADIEGTPIRYASSFRTMNTTPYEGETTYTEIKVFVPRDLLVEDWGIPDFERDGLAAWRFQPSKTQSIINLLGKPYISVAYPSTITPTRTGKISIGPAKVRLTTIQQTMNPYPQRFYAELYLNIPQLEYDAKPLPEGAPEGFDNAVGSFRLSASTSATDVKEGDPISVDLMVTGSGNLDTLRAPRLLDTHGWKIYEPTSDQRGDERRQVSGTVVFHQFMRPLELKPMIPPFRLVYFDPSDETYKTVTSEAIRLNMLPNTAPKAIGETATQAKAVPVERMTDILAAIKPANLTVTPGSATPTWIGHLAAGLIALGLILKAIWMRFSKPWKKDPAREARIQALREIEAHKSIEDVDFLKSAGNYIERWLSGNQEPEIREILSERDAECFQPEKSRTLLNPKRKSEILRTLRKAAMASIALGLLTLSSTRATADDVGSQALEAYESAKYEDAIKLWLSAGDYQNLSSDVLYNIANACYRSGSPGYAALYYRRALVRSPSHQEARQNLRFLERKYGSITIHRPEYQYALAKLPLSAWQGMLWTGTWLFAIALLVFPATRSGARIRLAAMGVLVIAPLIAGTGLLGWRNFPSDLEFAPVERQAVIIPEKSVLHVDAARTSPEVIDAPPGSLCEIVRQSGRWAYVAFASKTRGWIPVESLEKVIPDEAPQPPKFRKPQADGKTA
jgi:tetratricopeptide (TPR) repeat protein